MPEAELSRGGKSAQALRRAIEHVTRLSGERRADPALASALDRIGRWQAARLRQTYSDFAVDPRYAGAIDFFERDLYGGDFARRDADLARAVPLMVRLLPERMIVTLTQSVELNALSQTLDRALLAHLPLRDGTFDVAEYCRAFRATNERPARERQIALVVAVGAALDSLVGKPLVRTALLAMREPAKLAGMTALHDFLGRGFAAFRRMRGAAQFLSAIRDRESALLAAIFAGDDAPFSLKRIA